MTDAKAIRDGVEAPTQWRGPTASELHKRATGTVYVSGALEAVPADDYYRARADRIAAEARAEQDGAA